MAIVASITVGQVSGIIAAAVMLVQLVFPNAAVLIIASILGNEHNAATWSVVQRNFLSSIWPHLVRSDTAGGGSVNIVVRFLSALTTFGLLLIAIAAVVTPLGLHEEIVASNSNVAVPFTDLVDTSPVGIGTPARSSLGFSRACGNFAPLACPGSKTQVDLEFDPTDPDLVLNSTIIGTYDANVPESLIELYQSGLSTQPETVSSFFDIQSRQWTEMTDKRKLDGAPFLVDTFRVLDSMVLNDAIEAREGVIVDSKNGQVGFRHHRTPNNVGVGAEWEEDLLFLQPATDCVDTNLTLEFRIPPDGGLGSNMANLTLIDNGGFSRFITEYPTMNVTTTQEDPQLRFRAYKAAWLVNFYSMLIMNVTRPSPGAFGYLNSEEGKRFELASGLGSPASVNSIKSDTFFSSLVDPGSQAIKNTTNTFTNGTTTTGLYDNPFNLTGANYTDIPVLCQGAGGGDRANSSNIFIKCGLIYGAARRVDGQQSLIFRPGDVYQQSVYSCASVTRASIKTVSFRFNATDTKNLKSLTVNNITDKTYSDETGPNPPPLWGIETLNMALAEVQQLWGLISDANKDAPNMTAIRAPHLHLPGYTLLDGPSTVVAGYEFIPGSTSVSSALAAMYGLDGALSGNSDYSGAANLAMFQKWQNLSTSEAGVAKMLNIVWSDVAANSMMGTRGWGTGKNVTASGAGLSKRQSGGGSSDQNNNVMVPVKLYEKQVRYHWLYAIPALVTLALFVVVLATSCFCMLVRKGPKRMRYYINHLSAGRLLAEQRYPGMVDKQVSTKVWVQAVGKKSVALKDGYATPVEGAYAGGQPSPYQGQGMFYGHENKPGANASQTELHSLNPQPHTPTNGQGYMRVQS